MNPGYYWFKGHRVQRYTATGYREGWDHRVSVDAPIKVDSFGGNSVVLDFDGGMELMTHLSEYEGVFVPIERPTEKLFEAEYGRKP